LLPNTLSNVNLSKEVYLLNEATSMESQEGKFGFTKFAESWNGRLAMLGIAIGLATELMTGKGILEQLGLM
jgi:hypothetical protein